MSTLHQLNQKQLEISQLVTYIKPVEHNSTTLMILETLQKIGLSEKEAKVYIQLIHLGPQPVSVIAKRAEINRTTTYDIIDQLNQKGLLSTIKKYGITHYKALDPKNLLSYLEREKIEHVKKLEKQQKAIEQILPALTSLENPESTKPKVTFYEGEKGLRQAYEDTLTSSEPILAYANVEEMHQGLPSFFPEYYQRRAKEKRIAIKCIAPDNPTSRHRHKQDKKEKREMLLIPADQYDFSPEINIYDDKVLYASWREKMAIIIKSKEIADFHKQMYKLCWKAARAADDY